MRPVSSAITPFGVHAAGEHVAVVAVGGDDRVLFDRRLHADDHRLLADVQVAEAADQAHAVQLAHAFSSKRRIKQHSRDTRFAWWQAPLVTGLTPLACLAGRRDAYALGQGDWDASRQSFDGNPLTYDQARFNWLVDTLRRRPDLRLGGVTWGWLNATRASTAHLLAPGHAERLTLPCLIVRAGQETIVDNARIADVAARLPDVTLHDIPNARHEILRETDAVRAAFWQAFDRFCGVGNA
jgi:hypothetical protein